MNLNKFAAFILIPLLLVACSEQNHKEPVTVTADSKVPAYGDLLMESSLGDASNLIPFLASDSASHEVADLIYNGLVKYDKNLEFVPSLASSWEIEDGGRTLRFHLRHDVLWHDGVPFDGRDVMFTYRTIIDPETPTAYAGKYKLIKTARLIDNYTLEFTYDTPFAPAMLSFAALQIMPRHLLEGRDLVTSPLTRAPVGTGPFKFKSWASGSRIVLTANDDYFEGRPYVNGIVYRIIPDTTTQFMELKAGAIDSMGLTPLQYLRQTETPSFKRAYAKYRYLSSGYAYLGFNLKRKPFDDKRFRQAMAYAIDKEEIIKGVLLGEGIPATGPYKPGTTWYNPDVRRYPHAPQKALELLNEMGYTDHDGDGYLDRDGRPLSFTIITNQGNRLREKTAQIIQQRLAGLGIRVEIRIIEWTVFLKEFVSPGNFDAVILGWNILQDPDLYTVWHSSSARPGGLNHTHFINPEVDELLEQGRHTFDEAERKRCYDRIQEILAEEQPYIFLYVPHSLPVVSARFQGIKPAPAGIGYNLIRWHVPREQQRYHVMP